MRILTWNINGIRTLPQYHPWNAFKSFNDILNHLQADIICFQETKTSRSALSKSVAIPDSYHSFFSFPTRKTGYSGVVVYTRTDSVIPRKAEEGLSGSTQPKPPLSDSERVSNEDAYPPSISEELGFDLNFQELESEGRALTIDFGLFVLINVYCPNDGTGTEERDKFKMDFHRLLDLRVRGLVEKEGREVMVVGDINACAAIIDHCEGPLMVSRGQAAGMEGEEGFWEKECRRWLRDWLIHEDHEEGTRSGYFIDIVRRFWPDRKGMYTCWNTKIFARESNYGTRIDYMLVTKGLVPWIKAADVQQDVKGSDHCPVFVDLHDEITNEGGTVIRLRDVLGAPPEQPPPRIAAKYWDEFSGRQTQLHKFFTKKAPAPITVDAPGSGQPPDVESDDTSQASISPSTPNASPTVSALPQPETPIPLPPNPTSQGPTKSTPNNSLDVTPIAASSRPLKRKMMSETPLERVKKQKGKKAPTKANSDGSNVQTTLSSFYVKPKKVVQANSPDTSGSSFHKSQERDASLSCRTEIIDVDDLTEDVPAVNDTEVEDQSDLLIQPCSSQGPIPSFPSVASERSSRSHSGNDGDGKQVWSTILAPTPVPRCKVHDEPAKEFTVKKQGPNKGKRFFICSRPVGPGYDKGLSERPREEVDPQYRCNFFKWSSDARKELRRG